MYDVSKAIEKIYTVGSERSVDTVSRRCAKLIEECGETAEAFLNCTGENYKNKTWDDLREELTDVFITLTDIALTFMTPYTLLKIMPESPFLKQAPSLDHIPKMLARCLTALLYFNLFDNNGASSLSDDEAELLVPHIADALYYATAEYPEYPALDGTTFQDRVNAFVEQVEAKCNKWEQQLERRKSNGLAPI